MDFQKTFKIPVTGMIDEKTWYTMYNSVSGILNTLPPSAIALPRLIFPNRTLQRGSEGPEVYIIQQYLSYIASVLPDLPSVNPDGIYGPSTETAVRAFQKYFGINETGTVNEYTWNRIVETYRNLRFGSTRNTGQYPGTNIAQ
jgi:peptidoglycan hydrolase-like protein with peptidoglycan-binding domain